MPPNPAPTSAPLALSQALLRARGLRVSGRKDEVQLRLAEALLGEHAGGSTPTDLDTPGVQQLLASGAGAAKQQQGQKQGQQQQAGGSAGGEEEDEEAAWQSAVEAALAELQDMPYADMQRALGERGLRSSGKKAEVQVGAGGWAGGYGGSGERGDWWVREG